MTTPRKAEIEKRARELYVQQCYASGTPELADVNPEVSELRESGFWSVAISELMTSEKRKHEQWLNDSEDLEMKELAEVFDLNEILASGIYCSGTSGHGKSDVLMYVADMLKQNDVIVIVVDSSQDWQNRSSINQYQTLQNTFINSIPQYSIIYDISLLTIPERQTFAENFSKLLYERQVKTPKQLRKQYFLIFEESHVYLTEWMLRSKNAQNITRLLTEGRNYNVRFACITQFASLISKIAMKFMRTRFFGYADEPNDLKFISGFLGQKYVKELRNLEHGSFIAYTSGKLNLVHVEPYESQNIKTQINIQQTPIQPLSMETPKQDISTIAMLKIGMLLFFIVATITSLRGM